MNIFSFKLFINLSLSLSPSALLLVCEHIQQFTIIQQKFIEFFQVRFANGAAIAVQSSGDPVQTSNQANQPNRLSFNNGESHASSRFGSNPSPNQNGASLGQRNDFSESAKPPRFAPASESSNNFHSGQYFPPHSPSLQSSSHYPNPGLHYAGNGFGSVYPIPVQQQYMYGPGPAFGQPGPYGYPAPQGFQTLQGYQTQQGYQVPQGYQTHQEYPVQNNHHTFGFGNIQQRQSKPEVVQAKKSPQ